jgi:hypothetical protein
MMDDELETKAKECVTSFEREMRDVVIPEVVATLQRRAEAAWRLRHFVGQQEATEQSMHHAWRKRAEEAESENSRLVAALAAAERERDALKEPQLFWYVNNMEYGTNDLYDLMDGNDMEPGFVGEVSMAHLLPRKWIGVWASALAEDGLWEERECGLFDTEAEAKEAAAKRPPTPGGAP